VFFRQVDSEFVKHLTSVARQTAEQSTVPVHHNKTKLTIVSKQSRQRLQKYTPTHIHNHTNYYYVLFLFN